MVTTLSVIGTSLPRAEGPDKVTGRAKFTADILLPGALWGKILRSPYPHARILSIDASGAWEVPGVRAVVTGKDIPGKLMGRRLRDMPVLAWDKVRFIGDRVAAVAADSADAAEEALQRIAVEFDELPAVFDPDDAMQPGAPLLHDDVKAYDGAQDAPLVPHIRNGLTVGVWKKGDIAEGFKAADLVIEHTFRVPSRHTGYIEPHAGAVAIDADGRIQAWMSTKSPFGTRSQLAKAIEVPEHRIRVNVVNVGGDFGGKGDAMDLPIAYYLAQQAGAPVKIVMTYLEELIAGNPSHPSVITIRTGVTRDGRMVARYLKAVHNSGAYGAFKPTPQVSIGGASHGGGPYRIDHTYFEAYQVYTNTVPCGFFRAPGATQINFAVESHTDLIARELGMDPAAFRLKNVLQDGDVNAVGTLLRNVKAKEVLEAALQAIGWDRPKPGPNYGRGIAMYDRSVGGGLSGAAITADPDGTLTLLSPTFDQGVGTHTIIRQLVAEEMKLPVERVRVVIGDTDTAPRDGGVGGSRVTNAAGQAFLQAVTELRQLLGGLAAVMLECPEEEVVFGGERLWPREDERRTVTLAQVVNRAGEGQGITVTVSVNATTRTDISCFCAQVAEVEVDPETGQVKVHRIVTAHDVGTVMNPITHQGQIDGAVIQGLGAALMEELASEDGRVTTVHLGDYKLPTMADVPELTTILIPAAGGPAPYEGKAIGEMANNTPPAAIANAVYDAVDVRIFETPITAEKVFFALRDKADKS